MSGSSGNKADREAQDVRIAGNWRVAFVHPLPQVAQQFFDGLREGRLIGHRCPGCGRVDAQPRIRCAYCHARKAGEHVEIGPQAIIRAVCLVQVPMAGLEQPPGAVACVQPSGADSAILVRLTGAESTTAQELPTLVGRACRFCPPAAPEGDWADLQFKLETAGNGHG